MKKRLYQQQFSRTQMVTFILAFAAIGGLILLTTKAAGPNIWVSTTGSDSSCVRGDSSKPCLSFQKACSIAQGGDVISMAAGTYAPQVVTCTPASTVTFTPANGATVIVSAGGSCFGGCGLDINGASNLTFNNMSIGDRWTTRGNASFITLNNVSAPKLFIQTSNNITVNGGTIGPYDDSTGAGGSHIYPSDSSSAGPTYIMINGVTFRDYTCNAAACATNHYHGPDCLVYAGSGTGQPAAGPVTVQNSNFSNCRGYDFIAKPTWNANSLGTVTVQNNMFGATGTCSDATNCPSGWDVSTPVEFACNDGGGTNSNVNFRFNSIDRQTAQGASFDFGPSSCTSWNAASLVVQGNIFQSMGGNECSHITQSYNVVVSDNCSVGTNTVSAAAISEFTNRSSVPVDFHLSSVAAPAIDKGGPGPCAVASDYDGDTRPHGGACDAGADENINSNPCTITINSGNSLASTITSAAGGSTICLNSGDYGNLALNNVTHTSDLIVRPAAGATITFASGFTLSLVTHLHFTGSGGSMSVAGMDEDPFNGPSHDLTFDHIDWTGAVTLRTDGTGSSNILFDSNTFYNINAALYEGRLSIRGYSNTSPVGVTVSNNKFGQGGCSDGIQIVGDANGVQIGPGNDFSGITQGSCASHNDPIQFYGAVNTLVTGNYFHDNGDGSGGVMSPDGDDGYTITNNVFNETGQYAFAINMGGCAGCTVTHNTFINSGLNISTSNQGTPSTGVVARDNLFKNSGISIGGSGNTYTLTYNLNSGQAGTGNITGTPFFTGGANPATYSGFVLATNSPGHNSASDGTDIGISLSGGSGTTPGDLNNDSHVNILDLSILLSHYGQSATSSQGDINNDGTCNILDLSILLSHYGS